MPGEHERHQPPPGASEELAARMAAQVAEDQAVLAEARESLREITDAERDQLREAVAAADAAMPSETSNAPVHAWIGVAGDGTLMRAWSSPTPGCTIEVEYVRKDVADAREKALIEALEFYAADENYDERGVVGQRVTITPAGWPEDLAEYEAVPDRGARAEAVLDGEQWDTAAWLESVDLEGHPRAACSEGDNDASA